ncbi:3-hydroxybutyryl-CoA dehydrogenase [Actinokineospora guangxiensis]|uniref:3-hydroxybutyryl-CoA dehydrogenase n=1 Tax=Actinokineospora guangxiensis TaxID=1490288 RepID=A0ABW0EK45_9PSEU
MTGTEHAAAPVRQVGVVGCGQMGAGFAEICARRGLAVHVVAPSEDSVGRGRARLRRSLDRLVRKEKIDEGEREAALDRITFSTELKDLRHSDFVLESIAEDLAAKSEVFAALDLVVEDPAAVLASTTSSLPIMRIGRVADDPARVIGVHFFNPVQVMPLVEVIGSLRTSEATVARTVSFLDGVLGKQVVRVKDQVGFMVNSVFVPFLMSAVRAVESGVATAEDVDRGLTQGCGHPMGPLALIDMIGLDTVVAVGEAMYAETKEPLHAPPALLLRMVEGGFLGRKSGRGFYEHPAGPGQRG